METHKDFFEQLHPWLKAHPKQMSLIPVMLGLLLLSGAIFNWDWLLAPGGTWRGLSGISAYFGRKYARIICGIAGLLLFYVAYGMFSSKTW